MITSLAQCAIPLVLSLSSATVSSYRSPVLGEEFTTACGPLACTIATEMLGVQTSIQTMITQCGWQKDARTSIAQMRDALHQTKGVDSRATRLSPSELVEVLTAGDAVVILVVRKYGEMLDHAVVAIGMDGDNVSIFDYPELINIVDLDELCGVWDGHAIVVHRAPDNMLARPLSIMPGTSAALFFVIVCSAYEAARRRRRSDAVTRMHRRQWSLWLRALLASTALSISSGALGQSVHEETFDFGAVPAGTTVRHTFRIANNWVEELRLDDELVSCGSCVRVDRSFQSLRRGDVGEIGVSLDTTGRRGVLAQWAAFPTNARKIPLIKLNVRGIVQDIWTEPTMIDLGVAHSDDTKDRQFTVLAAALVDAQIVAVESSNPAVLWVSWDMSTVVKPTVSVVRPLGSVAIRWYESKRLGHLTERVTIYLAIGTTSRQLVIPVSVYAVGMVDARPARIVFGRIINDEKEERVIRLKWRGDVYPRTEDLLLRCTSPHIDMSFETLELDERTFSLRVEATIPHDHPSGLIEGTIRGQVNGSDVFAIPYTALVCR